MILMVDNYDSFVFNLVQYFRELGREVEVVRNDRISVAQVEAMDVQQLIISPGPCTPDEAGRSLELIRHFAGRIPILGVCLGHQAIGQAFGAKVVRNGPMHGKTSKILHRGQGVFSGLPSPFEAARYHSLVVDRSTVPACLEVTAETEAGEIMALRHREYPVIGVQFHPEAILTQFGHRLLENFLKLGINVRGEQVG